MVSTNRDKENNLFCSILHPCIYKLIDCYVSCIASFGPLILLKFWFDIKIVPAIDISFFFYIKSVPNIIKNNFADIVFNFHSTFNKENSAILCLLLF